MCTDFSTPTILATPGKYTNQNLITGIREMNQTWNQKEVSDHAMEMVKVDFER